MKLKERSLLPWQKLLMQIMIVRLRGMAPNQSEPMEVLGAWVHLLLQKQPVASFLTIKALMSSSFNSSEAWMFWAPRKEAKIQP